MLNAGLVLLHALHSLPHSVVEVVVARLDHLGYQLKEGVRSEVVGMAIPVLLSVMVVLLAQGYSQEVNLNYIWNNIFYS